MLKLTRPRKIVLAAYGLVLALMVSCPPWAVVENSSRGPYYGGALGYHSLMNQPRHGLIYWPLLAVQIVVLTLACAIGFAILYPHPPKPSRPPKSTSPGKLASFVKRRWIMVTTATALVLLASVASIVVAVGGVYQKQAPNAPLAGQDKWRANDTADLMPSEQAVLPPGAVERPRRRPPPSASGTDAVSPPGTVERRPREPIPPPGFGPVEPVQRQPPAPPPGFTEQVP